MALVIQVPRALFLFLTSAMLCHAQEHRIPMSVALARRIQRDMSPEEKKDPIVISETNSRFHPMAFWFLDKLKKVGVDKPLMIALDTAAYRRLKKVHPYVARYRGLELNYTQTRFGTPHYNEVCLYKWRIVLDLLSHGFDILLSDIDVYWKRNPLPYLRTLPRCDMFLTTDLERLPTTPANQPQIYPPFNRGDVVNYINTGFYLFRSIPRIVSLVTTLVSMTHDSDQFTFNPLFNDLYKAHKDQSRITHTEETCGNYGNLTFHVLRADLFQNRRTHVENQLRDDYYTLHYNYLGDYSDKIREMVQHGVMNEKYSHAEMD